MYPRCIPLNNCKTILASVRISVGIKRVKLYFGFFLLKRECIQNISDYISTVLRESIDNNILRIYDIEYTLFSTLTHETQEKIRNFLNSQIPVFEIPETVRGFSLDIYYIYTEILEGANKTHESVQINDVICNNKDIITKSLGHVEEFKQEQLISSQRNIKKRRLHVAEGTGDDGNDDDDDAERPKRRHLIEQNPFSARHDLKEIDKQATALKQARSVSRHDLEEIGKQATALRQEIALKQATALRQFLVSTQLLVYQSLPDH